MVELGTGLHAWLLRIELCGTVLIIEHSGTIVKVASVEEAGPGQRRGRLPDRERAARRAAVLDAAFAELLEHGAALTMAGVAARAGASKETLYSWFGSREGMLAALRDHQGAGTVARMASMFEDLEAPMEEALGRFAVGLLGTLTSESSVVLNRAAMSSPALAELLLAQGRYAVGPVVEEYLARQTAAGRLAVDDPADAFRLLYGMIVRDSQILALLGEPPPGPERLAAQAASAVTDFLTLVRPHDD
jgi:AcrR family transcriptional regulator